MENIGYKVTALNLTSAGIDRTDANTVRTFDEYNRPLLDFLTNLPENEKVKCYVLYYMVGQLWLNDFSLIMSFYFILFLCVGDIGGTQCGRLKCDGLHT